MKENYLLDSDAVYEHKCKDSTSGYSHDGKYKIYNECRMKNPSDGVWLDAVAYYELNSSTEMKLFVRAKADFIDKFQEVK